MGKVLRYLLYILLVWCMWPADDNQFANGQADTGEDTAAMEAVAQVSSPILKPSAHNNFSEAEINGNGLQARLPILLRAQRIYSEKAQLSLKEWTERRAYRESIRTSYHNKRRHTDHLSFPVSICEYYVFALRKILI